MNLHVFVAMPFGVKENINFDKVYEDLIKPALESEGFDVFRADEEKRAGEIRTDMFQELLLADLVVVDLSIDNPNVWYELGVRHALRSRGVIQIKSKRDYMPFDVYTDRTLSYSLKAGVPDPSTLERDKTSLAKLAVETCNSWFRYKISPVYRLLPYLLEPDWKTHYIRESGELWEKQQKWERQIDIAKKKQRPGDILVLADEAPSHPLICEAFSTAGNNLTKLGHFDFALKQFEKIIQIDPANIKALRGKGIALNRLKQHDEAKSIFKHILAVHSNDPETLALLGRVEKDAWISSWRKQGANPAEMIRNAALGEGLLKESIDKYYSAFFVDPVHYYSGINALTLHYLKCHLATHSNDDEVIKDMLGAIKWAIRSALSKETVDKKDYWARVSLAELELLVSDTVGVERAYKDAVAVAEGNWFDLDSSRQQLQILKDLGFRSHQVEIALTILERAIEKVEVSWIPKKVILFSGHMIDAPGRIEPRFPAAKEEVVRRAISEKLDRLNAADEDLALCGGACGGDLIFAEECLKRGLHLQINIPFPEAKFLEKSVTFAGDAWRMRFNQVKMHGNCNLLVMPDELGPTPGNKDSYERNNNWLLYTALSWGLDKVSCIALWNGRQGDGRGGTNHMIETVKRYSGETHIIDTTTLW